MHITLRVCRDVRARGWKKEKKRKKNHPQDFRDRPRSNQSAVSWPFCNFCRWFRARIGCDPCERKGWRTATDSFFQPFLKAELKKQGWRWIKMVRAVYWAACRKAIKGGRTMCKHPATGGRMPIRFPFTTIAEKIKRRLGALTRQGKSGRACGFLPDRVF